MLDASEFLTRRSASTVTRTISGGMRSVYDRDGLSCKPQLLIADEPHLPSM
jgi:ABC-type glutathione transport system ATPase component